MKTIDQPPNTTITDLRTHLLTAPEYPHGAWILVRLTTDAGVEGVGECFVPDRFGQSARAARELVEHAFKRTVLGRSVLDIAPLWEDLYDTCRRLYDRRGTAIHALSGIDMALYDAAGKTLGVPVHTLLGGRCRDRVRLYISSIWIDPDNFQPALDATAQYVAEGFTALKYYGWPDFGSQPRRDTALLQQLRHTAGEHIDLMLDLGRPANLTQALRQARLIENSGADIYWWEEPLSTSDELDDIARLSARTDLTIAAGEAELTAFAFRDLVQRRAVDLLQPDLSWVGGLTEARRIAELARLHRIPLVPHNWGTAINTAASIHLVAAMPAGFLCEYPITPRIWSAAGPGAPSPMMTDLVRQPLVVEAGHARVPTAPGLGVDLDLDVVAHYSTD